jgi:hypothetical protein
VGYDLHVAALFVSQRVLCRSVDFEAAQNWVGDLCAELLLRQVGAAIAASSDEADQEHDEESNAKNRDDCRQKNSTGADAATTLFAFLLGPISIVGIAGRFRRSGGGGGTCGCAASICGQKGHA